jgi:hypothetical protein
MAAQFKSLPTFRQALRETQIAQIKPASNTLSKSVLAMSATGQSVSACVCAGRGLLSITGIRVSIAFLSAISMQSTEMLSFDTQRGRSTTPTVLQHAISLCRLIPVTFPVLPMRRVVSSLLQFERLAGEPRCGTAFVALARPLAPHCQRGNDSKMECDFARKELGKQRQ